MVRLIRATIDGQKSTGGPPYFAVLGGAVCGVAIDLL
jgi:hypothetical protein